MQRTVCTDKNWKHLVISPDVTVEVALTALDRAGMRFLMVADEAGRLLGTVTDGDVRRALLKKQRLESPLRAVMNSTPRIGKATESRENIRSRMRHFGLEHTPLVDSEGRIVGIETFRELRSSCEHDAYVFLMAGGFGTRLQSLTEDCPKPMLHVGGKPLLERILQQFVNAGFRRFFISVHYLAEKIKAHFGDGSRWGVNVEYIEEPSPLGTGGAIGMLPESIDKPVIVMNGDILTELDFAALVEFYQVRKSVLTVCVREYDMCVPFGVIEGTEGNVTRIDEKPTHRFFVNAGIYVVSPSAVSTARPVRRLDMPDLIENLVASNAPVSMFPIHEYWIDIGRPEDFALAATNSV
jgi:dTDP-glucose pyrophosphorylase/CBS domain-containing protein